MYYRDIKSGNIISVDEFLDVLEVNIIDNDDFKNASLEEKQQISEKFLNQRVSEGILAKISNTFICETTKYFSRSGREGVLLTEEDLRVLYLANNSKETIEAFLDTLAINDKQEDPDIGLKMFVLELYKRDMIKKLPNPIKVGKEHVFKMDSNINNQ